MKPKGTGKDGNELERGFFLNAFAEVSESNNFEWKPSGILVTGIASAAARSVVPVGAVLGYPVIRDAETSGVYMSAIGYCECRQRLQTSDYVIRVRRSPRLDRHCGGRNNFESCRMAGRGRSDAHQRSRSSRSDVMTIVLGRQQDFGQAVLAAGAPKVICSCRQRTCDH